MKLYINTPLLRTQYSLKLYPWSAKNITLKTLLLQKYIMETLSIFRDSLEGQFLIKMLLSIFFGTILWIERQFRGKDAGIRTYSYVILWAMIFTFLSEVVDPNSTSRIAAQIVTWIWFLGAGLIIKDTENTQIRNLTTAASIWYAWWIGMIIWFGYYALAWLAAIATFLVPLISNTVGKWFDVPHK